MILIVFLKEKRIRKGSEEIAFCSVVGAEISGRTTGGNQQRHAEGTRRLFMAASALFLLYTGYRFGAGLEGDPSETPVNGGEVQS